MLAATRNGHGHASEVRAFWSNKGGVGKTFLCFATAAEYARQHPDVSVVVMDLCPQANISRESLARYQAAIRKLVGLL